MECLLTSTPFIFYACVTGMNLTQPIKDIVNNALNQTRITVLFGVFFLRLGP